MSFQFIIDRAESISINRKKMVGQTTARSGQVRAVSRGTQPKIITVQLPSGIPWTELRTLITAAEALDRFTSATITIPYAKFPWYYGNVQPGSDESYTVLCTTFPEWTIMARNQVSWSGAFVFTQVI
jgi:hypothetical protein